MKDIFTEINGLPCILTVPEAEGFAIVNGKFWRWEETGFGGPIFINRDGSDRERTPGPKHPVWKAYAKWSKWHMKQKQKGRK